MLQHLTLRDFVIVDRLELDFSNGFGALTGETGAGKSILIDALALALGERGDAGVVRSGCDRAEISATFEIASLPEVRFWLDENGFEGEEELLLRRLVDASGRSRAWINGSSATVQQLREIGEFLVDIHGQHAHQSLLRADAQRQLLDNHALLGERLAKVSEAWRAWRAAEQSWKEASVGAEALRREREQLEWQAGELAALAFTADEWGELELEHRRLGHAASLIEGAQYALAVLADDEAACERQIDRVSNRLSGLTDYDPALAEVAGVLASVQAELSDAVSSLRRYADRVDLDPSRLREVEARMDAVLAQARKHRVQPAELPSLLTAWQRRLGELSAIADVDALRRQADFLLDVYRVEAQALTLARQQAAGKMSMQVSEIMQQLALSLGRFEVALVPLSHPAVFGLEQVEFRIAGLAGNEAKPLAKVASGGELSRISLAIQVLTSRSVKVPTLVFDEVDVGIGGGVAEIVGQLLRELGSERQVLCVTHLPQVAAKANWQWQVSKTNHGGMVLSSIQPLDDLGRVNEIARMLGGVEITEITLRHARELLRSTSEKGKKR